MKEYLKRILPRLKQFSEDLNRKEIFVDKSWVLINEDSDLQRYIFKRDGKLIMSRNGDVQVGKWDYLPEAKSLLIDRVTDSILLNQDFIDQSVMLLRKDGDSNFFILASDSILKDFDITSYFRQLYRTKNNVFTIELGTGDELELLGSNRAVGGMQVSLDGDSSISDVYHNKNGKFLYYVENGKITKVIERTTYKTKKGNLIIEQERDRDAKIGDFAYLEDALANGKFNIGLFKTVHTEKGIIVNVTSF